MKLFLISTFLFINYSLIAQDSQAELVLPISHTHRLNKAAFSEDGSFLATADILDSRIFIWDVYSGRLLKELEGHQHNILDIMFTKDGELISCAGDSLIIVWDLKKGIKNAIYKSPFLAIKILKSDSQIIELRTQENSLYSLNKLDSSYQIKIKNSFRIHNRRGRTKSPKGTYEVEKRGNNLLLYLADSSEVYFKVDGHEQSIHYYLFSENEKYLLTADINLKAQLWDVEKRKRISLLNSYTISTTSVAYEKNERQLVNTSWNGDPFIWDFNTGKLINTAQNKIEGIWKNPEGVWSCLLFPEKGYYIACSQYSNVLQVFDLKSGKILKSIVVNNTSGIWDLQKGINKNEILASLNTGGIVLINLNEPHNQQVIGERSLPIKKLSVNLFDSTLIAGSINNKAIVYNYKTREVILEKTFNSGVYAVKHSPKGNFYALGIKNGLLQVFNSHNHELVNTFKHDTIIHDITFTSDEQLVISASYDKTVKVWSLHADTLVYSLNAHKNWCYSAYTIEEDKYLVTTGADYQTIVWDLPSGRKLYTRLQLTHDDWLVYDEHYRYDGTSRARDLLYFVCGTEVIELNQVKDALYVPNLVQRIMQGLPIDYPKLSELNICNALPTIEQGSSKSHYYSYLIAPKNYPLTFAEVYINDKLVYKFPAHQLKKQLQGFLLEMKTEDIEKHFIPGEENSVNVVGVISDEGAELRSRGFMLINTKKPTAQTSSPKLHAVFIGINGYREPGLDLDFPAKDADDLGKALRMGAEKMFGDTNVHVYFVHDDLSKNPNKTPEKENIRKTLEQIGKVAKAEDVVLLFFAGHGEMQGATEKYFTLLTAEYTKSNPVGINTRELQEWLSYDGPHKMLANKSILIFDACNSGQATTELLAMANARNEDESQRIRQIEDLKDKSGMFIFAASSAGQAAYEVPLYQQGLLTYSMLYTLKNNPSIVEDGGFLNLQKWFLESEKYLGQIVARLGLKQQAQPVGTTNIRIAKVDEELREKIILVAEGKIFISSNIQDEDLMFDELNIGGLLDKELTTLSRGNNGAPISFFQSCNHSDVWQLIGRYHRENGKIKLHIIARHQGKIQFRIEKSGLEIDLDALTNEIVKEVITIIKENKI